MRPAATPDRIAIWIGGGCGAAGAAGGFFVGFAYTRDQGDPALAPLSGALGLFVGALLGLLDAIVPVVRVAAVEGRRWAAATPLRAVVPGVAAAVPVGAVNLVSGAGLPWLMSCALVLAVPAAIATLGLDRRRAWTSRTRSAAAT